MLVKMVINKSLDIKGMGTTKCLSLDRNSKNCVFHRIKETQFCKFHQYMVSYSSEMLSQLELCKGCKKMYYFGDDIKTCEKCRDRGKLNKDAAKESVVLCSKSGCKFKRSVENEYCGKHQLCLFEDETKILGKKTCYNIIRGCRSQLEFNYKFSRCEECLEKEREKDKNRRKKVVSENDEVVNLENRTTKFCTTCIKELPLCKFIRNYQPGTQENYSNFPSRNLMMEKGKECSEGRGGGKGEPGVPPTKTCLDCRRNNKIQDVKRDKERRNELARKNEAKPERKEVKKEWAENNYEKVALKTMNYRQRKMEEDQEGYLANNAEQAKKWRENNPEKMIESNENKKNSKEINYSNYKRNAEYKNLDFNVSFEEYSIIVTKECHYCGVVQEKGFNGIDRKDQSVGYIVDNCVSCCKMCNYMKGSTCEEVFIKRAEHILTFQGKIQGNLYPECFANHKSGCYSDYRRRALKKQLDFLITPDDYNLIIKKDCFMCGKKSDQQHQNGIDRMDNTKGYILENINACCCECNLIKKDYVYEDIINKILLIHKKQDSINETNLLAHENVKLTIDEPENPKIKENRHLVVNRNKKTKEEIKDANRLYKQKQREKMKEKYGDEEYKKIRAKEIADTRAKRKENNLQTIV